MSPFPARLVSGSSSEPVIVLGYTAGGEPIVVRPSGVVERIPDTYHLGRDELFIRIVVDSFVWGWPVSDDFRDAFDREHERVMAEAHAG